MFVGTKLAGMSNREVNDNDKRSRDLPANMHSGWVDKWAEMMVSSLVLLISRKGIVAGSFGLDGRVQKPGRHRFDRRLPRHRQHVMDQTPIMRRSFLIRSLLSIQAINSPSTPSWQPMQT